jgi:chemotaxis protein CheC
VELNEPQRDALIELINVGFGRAGAALSKLTGYRVVLEVPNVGIYPVNELGDALRPYVRDQIATVHQIFSGPVGGDALLILDQSGAATLKQLLTDEGPLPLAADASAREVLTEIGNILINACLGTLGNLLDVHVTFSVPQLTLETLAALLDSLTIGREGVRYALVVHAGFRLRDSEIKGYMIIVLSVASLDRLLRAIEQWEQGQA